MSANIATGLAFSASNLVISSREDMSVSVCLPSVTPSEAWKPLKTSP